MQAVYTRFDKKGSFSTVIALPVAECETGLYNTDNAPYTPAKGEAPPMKTSPTAADLTPLMQGISHFHHDTADGSYDLTFYPILPGVMLAYNDVHTTAVPAAPSQLFDECLVINYCREGRCEFTVTEDNYCYIDNGMSSISTHMVQGRFYYPSGYYAGCEFYIFPPLFTAETHAAEKLFELDFTQLRQDCLRSMVYATPQELMVLWEELYKAMQAEALGAVRLRALRVLEYLCTHKTAPQSSSQYLTRTQAMLAKKLEEELTRDLSRRVPVYEVAAALGVGETSLKNYFRSVYGVNVSVYQNDARMKLAARLLAETEESISTIARRCGYVNQGRFAGVFYRRYHMKPLDYRRSSRMPTEGADT